MADPIPEVLKNRFFVLDMQIRQLKHNQLSSYLQIWVLAMEAVFLGLGIVMCLYGGFAFMTEGPTAAFDAVQQVSQVAIGMALGITVFLRVVWWLVTLPERVREWRELSQRPMSSESIEEKIKNEHTDESEEGEAAGDDGSDTESK